MANLHTGSSDGYLRQLQQLLPRGAAWTRATGERLTGLLHAFADELAHFHARIKVDLFDQADPRSTDLDADVGMLEAWERNFGLPDCSPTPETLGERQAALTAKVASQGGQTAAHMKRIAEAAGGTSITVTELYGTAWRCDSSACDEPITSEDILFSFEVAGSHNDLEGEIECAVDNVKPAHTFAFYTLS